MATKLKIDPIITDHNEDGTPAFTFEPWTDGHAIGYKVTRHSDGKVGYVAINPSQDTWSDDRFNPDVFVYTGISDDVALDNPMHYYNIDFGDDD